MGNKVNTDPTSGEYVGEWATHDINGDTTRQTEWFSRLEDAKYFCRTGIARNAS